MMNLYLSADLARARQRELVTSAARTRLAALARCCRVGKVGQMARAFRARLRPPVEALCC